MLLLWSYMVENGNKFKKEFLQFLQEYNFSYTERDGRVFLFEKQSVAIVLIYLSDFEDLSKNKSLLTSELGCDYGERELLYLYEDRWFFNKEFVKKRVLARLGSFVSIFARKCRIIDDAAIKADSRKNILVKQFLKENHTYGEARCKYRYVLEYEGRIVAVATFSAPRPMPRGIDKVIVYDSYEWVRYASLPDCRVVGGMGRLLKAFLKDLQRRSHDGRQDSSPDNLKNSSMRPVEIMTYADLEWSCGDVYSKLGFELVCRRESVEFLVNRDTFERIASNKFSGMNNISGQKLALEGNLSGNGVNHNFITIRNMGSGKYLYQQPAI